MSIDAWLANIAEQGVLGALLVIVGVGYWLERKEVKRLNKEKFDLAERVFKIVEKLTRIIKDNGGT